MILITARQRRIHRAARRTEARASRTADKKSSPDDASQNARLVLSCLLFPSLQHRNIAAAPNPIQHCRKQAHSQAGPPPL